MIVGNRYFCSRNQIHILVFYLKHISSKLRKLAGANHAGCINDIRREYFCITMLSSMSIQHKVINTALQAGTQASVESETSSGNLAGSFKIQNVQVFANIPVIQWLEGKLGRFHPSANYRVVLIALTQRNIRSRHIRNIVQNSL